MDPGSGSRTTANVSFSMGPRTLTADSRLSDRAFRLFHVLHGYVDLPAGAVPSRAALASKLNCSVKSIDRAISELTELGALTVKRRWRTPAGDTLHEGDDIPADAWATSNQYHLVFAPSYPPPPAWLQGGRDTGDATRWGQGCTEGGDTGDARGGDTGDARSETDPDLRLRSPLPPSGQLDISQQSVLDHLHSEVAQFINHGEVPPPGWCVDLARRGIEREDVDHAVQRALSRPFPDAYFARSYLRAILSDLAEEREGALTQEAPA
jgi:hypothetical protein